MMTGWLFVLVTIIGFAGMNLTCKVGGMKGASSLGMVAVLYAGGAVGMFIAAAKVGFQFSWAMVILAGVGGVAGAFGYLAFVKAVSLGHYAFSGAISCASFMLTVVFSAIVWTPITSGQAVGVGLLVAAVFLITFSSASGKSQGRGQWGRWAIMAGLAFVLNAVPQTCQSAGGKLVVPSLSFTFSFIFCIFVAGSAVLLPIAARMKAFSSGGRAAIGYGLIAAVASMAGNVLIMFAMEYLSEKVIFPSILSGTLMVGVLLSLAAFKEKINWIGYVGMAAEVAGIVVLNVYAK